ncbi:MAG: hypothetical protein ACOXZ4_03965 [Sphaerochaetaceae bacterium]
MKKLTVILLLLVLIGTSAVFAGKARDGIGAGLVTGIPFHIGATGEYNFGSAYAAADVGYGSNSFLLRLGGGYNFPTPFIQSDWGLDLYLSVGGNLGLYFSKFATLVSVGIPVTWTWYMDDYPVKIFVKAGPEIIVNWGGALGFTGSAGAYYLF